MSSSSEKIARARDLLYSYDPVALERARSLLYEALATTGDDANVFGWLAVIHCWMLLTGSSLGAATLAIADGFAQRAIALAPENAQAHWAKSEVEFMRNGALAAVPWGRTAVMLERNAESLSFLAYFLCETGASDEAIVLADESVARDPLNPALRWWRSWVLLIGGQKEHAAAAALELADSDYLMGTWAAGITLCYCGREAEGIALMAKVPTGENAPLLFEFAPLMIGALNRSEPKSPSPSAQLVEWTKTGDPFASVLLAGMYARVGDRDSCFHWMQLAINRGFVHERWWNERDPFVARYRRDADFGRLVTPVRSAPQGHG